MIYGDMEYTFLAMFKEPSSLFCIYIVGNVAKMAKILSENSVSRASTLVGDFVFVLVF